MVSRVEKILAALEEAIPDAGTELHHDGSWQLLMATILSAQCTDERVNQVTPVLFGRYPDAAALAQADPAAVEGIVQSTGFFRQKTRSMQECCRALVERHGGKVPETLETLNELPGVGRKTANLILGQAFGKPGIVVDTHVKRVARRLDLSRETDATKVELDLQQVLPEAKWSAGSSRLLLHGRHTCKAKKPLCARCAVERWCESGDKTV